VRHGCQRPLAQPKNAQPAVMVPMSSCHQAPLVVRFLLPTPTTPAHEDCRHDRPASVSTRRVCWSGSTFHWALCQRECASYMVALMAGREEGGGRAVHAQDRSAVKLTSHPTYTLQVLLVPPTLICTPNAPSTAESSGGLHPHPLQRVVLTRMEADTHTAPCRPGSVLLRLVQGILGLPAHARGILPGSPRRSAR
jgi:hypothetical protein